MASAMAMAVETLAAAVAVEAVAAAVMAMVRTEKAGR